MNGIVYILKFEQPMGTPRHSAQYYIGWCKSKNLELRLATHYAGNGAVITRRFVERNIGFRVVYIENGTRCDERALKLKKNAPRLVRKLDKLGKLISLEAAGKKGLVFGWKGDLSEPKLQEVDR